MNDIDLANALVGHGIGHKRSKDTYFIAGYDENATSFVTRARVAMVCLTKCLRAGMSLLISEGATGITWVQLRREGDSKSMIAVNAMNDSPERAICMAYVESMG